jgi:hypothetical protein
VPDLNTEPSEASAMVSLAWLRSHKSDAERQSRVSKKVGWMPFIPIVRIGFHINESHYFLIIFISGHDNPLPLKT